jgi:GT2 family glycosyltransferase
VEHIVVDGGSTDGTLDVLREYESTYDLEWVSEEDRGQTHAINKGMEIASGDWIGWQNSDDFYLPGSFESVADAIRSCPSVGAVYGDLLIVDAEGEEVTRQFMTTPSKFVQRYWSLFASNQSLFVRADVLDEIGELDEDLTLTMDADLTWRLLNSGYNLHHIPKFLGAFRIQEDAKTFDDVDDVQQAEQDAIYDHPWYETYLPESALVTAAKLAKFGHLIGERRWEAIRYNLSA